MALSDVHPTPARAAAPPPAVAGGLDARSLLPFQAEDVAFFARNDYRAINANSPGTGKTIECLACITQDPERLLPAIVVCPASVGRNWYREAKAWLGPNIKVQVLRKTDSDINPRAHIIVLSWSLLPRFRSKILSRRPRLLIADEAHYGKNPDSLRGRALADLAAHTPHVLALTGTPIVNMEEELWVLQALFGTTSPPMTRRLLEEVAPHIPPKSRTSVSVTLPASYAEEYKRAQRDFAAWLEEKFRPELGRAGAARQANRLLVTEALTKVGYLRRLLGEAKVDAAVHWIESMVRRGEPVVVFAEHQKPLRAIEKRLEARNIRYATLEGTTTRKARQRAIDRFQAGRVPVFLGSKAAKEGITLTRARHLLFVEMFFTAADTEQAEDRIRRLGQTRETTIWYLHAEGTLDDRVDEIVNKKRRIVRDVLGAAPVDVKDEAAIVEMLRGWNPGLSAAVGSSKLGHKKSPYPALPARNTVIYFLFDDKVWSYSSAVAWCRLHSYKPAAVYGGSGAPHRIEISPTSRFLDNSFHVVPVAKGLRAVCGTLGSTRKPTVTQARPRPGR